MGQYELYFSRTHDTADYWVFGQLIAEKDYKWDVPRQARLSGASVVHYTIPGAYDFPDVRLILDIKHEVVIFYDKAGDLRLSQFTGTSGTFDLEWYDDLNSYILVPFGRNLSKYDLARILEGFTITSALRYSLDGMLETSFRDEWAVCMAMAEFMLNGTN